MQTVRFPVAARGLGTEFSESSQPAEFALELENRYVNMDGAVEKRPALKRLTSPIDQGFSGKFDCRAEHVRRNGDIVELATRINGTARELYKFNGVTWSLIGNLATRADGFTAKAYSLQIGDKTVFYASDMRPTYYNGDDGAIYPLRARIISGVAAAGTSARGLVDADVPDWLNATYVSPNDLVYNVTKDAYGVVTSIGTTAIEFTPITTAAASGKGLGLASSPMAAGDQYMVIDAVSLNLFRQSSADSDLDNVAVAGAGSTGTVIAVSGTDFSDGTLRLGDYVYNTTKVALQRVESVSANINVTSVTDASAGDSLVFLKEAVPIATWMHVHYGRIYAVDERERNKVRISGPDDAQDWTTSTKTLESATIDYGSKQPDGEEILCLDTFQNYLVAAGKKNVYLSSGSNPIADTSATNVDLAPVGLFSQGAKGRRCLANIGSMMLYSSTDGMRKFSVLDVLKVQTDNMSEVIKTELRRAINDENDETKIQMIHYPARNWVMFKVSETIYNFNYSQLYLAGETFAGGTWSKFTGRLAECDTFTLKQDGTLVCGYYDSAGDRTIYYEFDTGSYTDDETQIGTRYKSAWLSLAQAAGQVCDGKYIKPYFENTSDTVYTIGVTSDIGRGLSSGVISVSADGYGDAVGAGAVGTMVIGGRNKINEPKLPLRWRGEQFQLEIATSAGNGRDVISGFTIYGNSYGLE